MSDPSSIPLRDEIVHLRSSVDEAALPMEFAKRAFTYLEAAERLLGDMEDGSWAANYYNGQVVLLLLHHSTELFLKSFIQCLQPAINVRGHSLRALADQLHEIDPSISFRPPFEVEALPPYPKLVSQAARANSQLHERFRYPTNNDGEPWAGLSGLSVEGCRRTIADVRAQCEALCTRFFP